MDNPDKFPVHYTLACTAPTFTPSHTSGVIKPQSSSEVAIRWAPIMDGSDTRQQQGHLVITMVGGERKSILSKKHVFPSPSTQSVKGSNGLVIVMVGGAHNTCKASDQFLTQVLDPIHYMSSLSQSPGLFT